MKKYPKIALGAWAWGNDGTFGVATAQVPVAWAVAKGTIPIVGATKPRHVEDAAKAAAVVLSPEETARLEQTADSLGLDTIRFWEKEMK